MIPSRKSRTEVEQLIASCEAISEFADRANLREVNGVLLQLLFILTDGTYGSARLDDDAPDYPEPIAGPASARVRRDELRALGRTDDLG